MNKIDPDLNQMTLAELRSFSQVIGASTITKLGTAVALRRALHKWLVTRGAR